jgi:hypothetical protein
MAMSELPTEPFGLDLSAIKDEVRIYAYATAADQMVQGGRFTNVMNVGVVVARSKQEAEGIALENVRRAWHASEGWVGHRATVEDITDFVHEATNPAFRSMRDALK